MFCVYCGTQIPDDAVFCSKCGKPQNEHQAAKPFQSPSSIDWEYWTWEAETPTGMDLGHPQRASNDRQSGGLTESQARLHFWQKTQSRVLPVIQQLRDDGWEPVTAVGPSSIRLDTEFRTETGQVDWSKWFKDTVRGVLLTGWHCYGLRIQFRRQRGSGKYSVGELPSLIKRAGY